MKSLVAASLCLLLAACASAPVAPDLNPARPSLYDDALFAPSPKIATREEIFALTPDMEAYLDNEIVRRVSTRGRIHAIVDALYSRGPRKFSYDARETGTAAEVFERKRGNCLSYTIMTAAFAKRLDLPVQFHVVTYGDVWDRSNDIDFRIGHVNLTVGKTYFNSGEETAQLLDFVALTDAHGQYLDDISEDVIASMFYNNRAAEAVGRGDLDAAYWWSRAATESSTAFLGAYNTLGVVYLHHNNPAMAARVFERVLEREPENVMAMSNEAIALRAMGRLGEADSFTARLKEIQPNPPFYYFNLGVQAMKAKDYATAKVNFTKEVNRASYNHQFHFWLAMADYNLGQFDEVKKHLNFAMENSPNDSQHDLYAAKLAALKQKQTNLN